MKDEKLSVKQSAILNNSSVILVAIMQMIGIIQRRFVISFACEGRAMYQLGCLT